MSILLETLPNDPSDLSQRSFREIEKTLRIPNTVSDDFIPKVSLLKDNAHVSLFEEAMKTSEETMKTSKFNLLIKKLSTASNDLSKALEYNARALLQSLKNKYMEFKTYAKKEIDRETVILKEYFENRRRRKDIHLKWISMDGQYARALIDGDVSTAKDREIASKTIRIMNSLWQTWRREAYVLEKQYRDTLAENKAMKVVEESLKTLSLDNRQCNGTQGSSNMVVSPSTPSASPSAPTPITLANSRAKTPEPTVSTQEKDVSRSSFDTSTPPQSPKQQKEQEEIVMFAKYKEEKPNPWLYAEKNELLQNIKTENQEEKVNFRKISAEELFEGNIRAAHKELLKLLYWEDIGRTGKEQYTFVLKEKILQEDMKRIKEKWKENDIYVRLIKEEESPYYTDSRNALKRNFDSLIAVFRGLEKVGEGGKDKGNMATLELKQGKNVLPNPKILEIDTFLKIPEKFPSERNSNYEMDLLDQIKGVKPAKTFLKAVISQQDYNEFNYIVLSPANDYGTVIDDNIRSKLLKAYKDNYGFKEVEYEQESSTIKLSGESSDESSGESSEESSEEDEAENENNADASQQLKENRVKIEYDSVSESEQSDFEREMSMYDDDLEKVDAEFTTKLDTPLSESISDMKHEVYDSLSETETVKSDNWTTASISRIPYDSQSESEFEKELDETLSNVLESTKRGGNELYDSDSDAYNSDSDKD